MSEQPNNTATQNTETDFEELDVSPERAQDIRDQVAKLKESEWMDSLRSLANELGQEYVEGESGDDLPLPGFSQKGDAPKVFTAPQGHPAEGLRIALQNTDLKVFHGESLLLELTFLPKDNDYVVYYLNESRLPELNEWVESLGDIIKAAKAAKSARQAEWAKRFKK